jgi:hypothetical protein
LSLSFLTLRNGHQTSQAMVGVERLELCLTTHVNSAVGITIKVRKAYNPYII